MNILLTATRSEEIWISDLWCAYTTIVLWCISGLICLTLSVLWLMSRRVTKWKLWLSVLGIVSSVFPLYVSVLYYYVDYVSYEMYLTGEYGESYDRHWLIELFWCYLPTLCGVCSLAFCWKCNEKTVLKVFS